MSIINLCCHCEIPIPITAKFCKDCKTAEGRRQMDKENKEILGKDYICKGCEFIKKMRNQKVVSYED